MNLKFIQLTANMSIYTPFKYFLVFVLTLSGMSSYAQNDLEKPEIDLSTPYSAINNQLKYLLDNNYDPKASSASIGGDNTPEERIDLTIKLQHVLIGKGIYIDVEDIPKNPNYKDSITNKQRFYPSIKELPDLYVEKRGNIWLYSKYSVSRIDAWHEDVYPFGTDKLLEIFPKRGNNKYLGLYFWQYLGLLFLLFIAFILHKIFTILFERILVRILLRMGRKKLAKELILPVAKPLSTLLIFPILMLFFPILQMPVKFNSIVMTGLNVIWPVFAVVFFYRLVDILSVLLMKLAMKTESTLDDQLVPLIRKALKTFVVIIGAIVVLDNLEVNVTGLIAGLSIGGLAFALAAQDTIKNFFGSLMIFFDKPFQVGDWITSGDVDGTVEEVGFRATRIRTFRNSVMYIPNGAITNQVIDNHGLRNYRRFFTTIAVTYDTPAYLIEAFVQGLKQVVIDHPNTRKDYDEIHFNDLGASSLNIMFYIFFKVPSWSDELKARHEILLAIIELAEEIGINFAFPTQTLHVETFPEKIGNSPSYKYDNDELKEKIQKYLQSKK